ncbi:MAG: hypothetical protein AAF693_06550 [Bacteroidota bacterium]
MKTIVINHLSFNRIISCAYLLISFFCFSSCGSENSQEHVSEEEFLDASDVSPRSIEIIEAARVKLKILDFKDLIHKTFSDSRFENKVGLIPTDSSIIASIYEQHKRCQTALIRCRYTKLSYTVELVLKDDLPNHLYYTIAWQTFKDEYWTKPAKHMLDSDYMRELPISKKLSTEIVNSWLYIDTHPAVVSNN